MEELCETEIRDQNNLQNRDGLQEASAGSDEVLSDDSGGTIRSVRKAALWPLASPVSRTGSPGSMLHIWPSPSAADGHKEVFVRPRPASPLSPPPPPPRPLSFKPQMFPVPSH